VDAVNIALQSAFILIFVVVLIHYLRDPRPVHRDLVLVFASVVALFAIAIVTQLVPGIPRAVNQMSAVVLLLQPYLTLRLAAHFVRVSRSLAIASLIWFGAAVVGIGIGTRGNPPVTIFVVSYFVTIETVAAFLLFRAARHRVGYARTRLRIAAAATVCFAVAILVSGAGAAAAAAGAATDPGVTAIARILALVAGLGYLAAFIPPVAIRRLQQRAVAFDLGQSFLGAPVDGDPDTFWVALAHAARTITNGPAALVALGTPPAVRIVDGTPPTPTQVGAPYEPPRADDGKDAGGVATISLPIESELGRQGWLVVYPDAGSLFLDDDRVLLTLLAGQAARAAERREAIRQQGVLESELEDASHELEFSRAQLESEERFRAALEAHPGILLVIEPDGRVGYANGQALHSLGYSAAEIRGRSLDDLLARAPSGRPSEVGTGDARRQDGTTFPVDFAVSTFESQGERSSIAVLTDITDRLETDHLRDTFIGILSHELRTPVTAIYGGSQVLLGRGEKLDPAVSRELIIDIAAEAERLHRLIENLLVLARVERGEELIGGEPVLLQRVLPTIVERERAIWLGTDISATVAPGLPTVRGHDGYVSQVIRNLLSNAVKYGGPTANVEIVAEGDEDGVSVRVLDDGPGIESGVADRLFDLYYRAPGAATVAQGAGIGLFVCRRIVTGLGGTIWAKSRPSGGAEFGFRLPIYEADEDLLPATGSGGELAAAS
jgi:PAS domain S-box-containing protein